MVDRTAKGDRSAIAAVLFDLDGTLADTAPDLGAALNRVRRDRGLDPVPLAQLRPYASHGARGLIGAGMSVAPGEPAYDELRDAFLAHYAAALCVDSALFADMGDVLDALDARALPWGIVTNKATRYTAPLLVSLQRSRRAGGVVCGATTPFAKPHPAPFFEGANRLGVAPERCVVFGRMSPAPLPGRSDHRLDIRLSGSPAEDLGGSLRASDENGRVAYKGKTGPFGFHPEELEAWLARRFPSARAALPRNSTLPGGV